MPSAEEGVHPGNQRLIGAQLLRIVKQQHPVVLGKAVHIVHPHLQRVHAAIQEHNRSPVFPAAEHIAELRATDLQIRAGVCRRKAF